MGQAPVAPMARVHVLGGFELLVGGQAAIDRAWPHRKAKALVKLLALQASRSLHRERVMELLWPDLDPKAAANNLRKSLYHLRTCLVAVGLGAAMILVSQDLLALAENVWVDYVEFLGLAAGALGSECNPVLFEGALALYQGDLLPEDLYEEWTAQPRNELRGLRNELLLGAGRIYAKEGQHDLAIARLRQLVHIEPAHEEAHRLLMGVYADAGNRDQALRQYGACRDALRREFDATPSQETEALFRRLQTT